MEEKGSGNRWTARAGEVDHMFLSLSVAPRIVVDPKPTTTDIGSDVTLTCVWVGNPPLTLTWTKKDSNMVNASACPACWKLALGWGQEQGYRG